jgi:hypothetical protein
MLGVMDLFVCSEGCQNLLIRDRDIMIPSMDVRRTDNRSKSYTPGQILRYTRVSSLTSKGDITRGQLGCFPRNLPTENKATGTLS